MSDEYIKRTVDIDLLQGSMQSMFQFLSEKKYTYGIRCSMENFGIFQNVKIYPLYGVSNIGKNQNFINI